MSKLQEYIQRYERIHTGQDAVLDRNGKVMGQKQFLFFPGEKGLSFFVKDLDDIIKKKNRAISVLDYGCGLAVHTHRKEKFLNNLTSPSYFRGKLQCYYLYDPCVPHYNQKPTKGSQFDVVLCTDVLEHIPKEHIDEVLQEINEYTKPDGEILLSISTRPAIKYFADGTNVHVTVESKEWWDQKLKENLSKPPYKIKY